MSVCGICVYTCLGAGVCGLQHFNCHTDSVLLSFHLDLTYMSCIDCQRWLENFGICCSIVQLNHSPSHVFLGHFRLIFNSCFLDPCTMHIPINPSMHLSPPLCLFPSLCRSLTLSILHFPPSPFTPSLHVLTPSSRRFPGRDVS